MGVFGLDTGEVIRFICFNVSVHIDQMTCKDVPEGIFG